MTAAAAAAAAPRPTSAQIMAYLRDGRRRRLDARALRLQRAAIRRRLELAALIAHLAAQGRPADRALAARLDRELIALDHEAARAAARCVAYAEAHPMTSY